MAPHTQERADRGHLLNVVISVDIRKREMRHYILDTHTHTVIKKRQIQAY